ncbi:MAG TPA: type II secretion system protein [Noviherbaspirillum sp.]|jgi:prepilin-type N-terminal cleavage/methylation domain-containing protein|uniref:type II secretion system protein n=1 Tax=Noviherbaspirillum sp. TaxID=1926288 RepID=UPI002DDD3130|nr:type II secretion system protein [Noviherbaspirillum sp.]HEV2611814.1 type II secretion system protein [Noviherbaspirillum sp.]
MPANRRVPSSKAGFTLIEMAIVVLIVSIMMTLGVATLSAQLESTAVASTKKRQEAIRDALVAYLAKNRRLPCPDNPAANAPNVAFDGIEDRAAASVAGPPPTPNTTTACSSAFGVVPYATLGISRELAQDGWSNLFSYQVSTAPYNWTLNASFSAGSQGGITVNTRNAAGTLTAFTGNAVVVLASHGKTALGAYTVGGTRNTLPVGVDEVENSNGNVTYVTRDFSNSETATGGTFDDILLVLQPSDLIGPALQTKALRSYEEQAAIAARDIEEIKNALIGYAINNSRLPNADSDGSGKPGCPNGASANDGVADNNCEIGNVPWVTLSVPANDPWAVTAPPAAVAIPNRYKYRVTKNLTNTPNKNAFRAQDGDITVRNESGVLLANDAPFVVYSLGRNNTAFFNNSGGVGAACTTVATVTPVTPVAPACLGTNEVANLAATGSFVKAPLTVPPFTDPRLGYDDILDYVGKGTIDAKLP